MDHAAVAGLAASAFIYGFPLVFDLEEVDRFGRHGMGNLPAAPFNVFAHATELAGPDDTFVSINNDTVYSIAQVDVSGGPVRLAVPDTDGRYHVLQFVDAWTNNFAYVGHRATGTGAGTFLLVAPGWDGRPAPGETVIRFPTSVASIVGRWAVDGAQDLPAVRPLQRALRLEETGEPGPGLPAPDACVPDALKFFEQLRTCVQAFPPAQPRHRLPAAVHGVPGGKLVGALAPPSPAESPPFAPDVAHRRDVPGPGESVAFGTREWYPRPFRA